MGRRRILLNTVLLVLFSTLVIDGFPLGAELLHEFGARPTNFILLITMVVLYANAMLSNHPMRIMHRDLVICLLVVFGIPALNLPVTLLQAEVPPGGPVADWAKQYGMLVWGVASYWLWKQLLNGIPSERLALLICVGSIIPLVSFFADQAGLDAFQQVLSVVRNKRDERVSGLATEPALYAAWLAFVWPMALFCAVHPSSRAVRAFAVGVFLAICATAVLSHARTIAVILVLQIAYYAYRATRHGNLLQRFRAMVAVGVVAVAALAVFASSLTSVADPEMGSNISRIGSTVTALRVAQAHPFVGVGIGQLKYFFGQYAPDFALASQEILNYATGVSEYRASSFNLFARFLCEFGFGVGTIFSIVILHPIVSAARLRSPDSFIPYAVLAAIGGTGFWLSQDQYGYQPAILSLAILTNALAARSGIRLWRLFPQTRGNFTSYG